MKIILRRRKNKDASALVTSSESFSRLFSPISTTPKEIGENSLAGFHNGYREMGGTSPAQLVRQSLSFLLSENGTRISDLPKLPSSPERNGSRRTPHAISHLERYSRHRWSNRYQGFERTMYPARSPPKPPALNLDRPLPPFPYEEDVASFQTPRDWEIRAQHIGGRTRNEVNDWIRTGSRNGTPF